MSYRVLLTDLARRQIEEASAWWAEHRSLEQALRWLEQIRIVGETVEVLAVRHVARTDIEADDLG